MPSLVVTGATGPLGRLIVEHLIARGTDPSDIVGVGRDDARLAALGSLGVATAVIDYSDPVSLETAFSGADTLMLVSGSEVGKRVAQHLNAIAAAQAAGVRRIVYTSAPHADDTELILAPEHKATEEAIRASGLRYVILRNGWYTENYAGAMQQAAHSGVFVASTGEGRVASASRTDYAEAAAVVLMVRTVEGDSENPIYELSGDYAWTATELAAAMTAVTGTPIESRSVTSAEHAEILRGAGLDDDTIDFVVGLDANTRDGLLGETSGELARLIGHPTLTLVEGLRRR